jgi:hypothetical protein
VSLRISFYKVQSHTGSTYHLSRLEVNRLHALGELQPWEYRLRDPRQHYNFIWLDSQTIQEAKTFPLRGLSCKPTPTMLRISEAFIAV